MKLVSRRGVDTDPVNGRAKRLESWKEIAAYLRRDVRTVMRWEHGRGLPVHRLPGGSRGPVYALQDEVDAWLARAPDGSSEPAEPISTAAAVPQTEPATLVPSIAVLPFVNLTADKENEYFADGLAEEIITWLTRLPGLRVTARTSSFLFRHREADARQIGAALGVSALLEGSLRRSGDRLRLNVQLVNVADGYHLWSEVFDRAVDDVFAIQEEISREVVRRLKIDLLPGEARALSPRHEPTQEAYHHYLKGRYFFNRRSGADMQRAIDHFEKACAADPQYALPCVGIAETCQIFAIWGLTPPRPAFERLKSAAARAIALDESLIQAHACLGNGLLLGDWDWEGARPHFERAEHALTSAGSDHFTTGQYFLNIYYIIVGRPEDAVRAVRATIERDPLSAVAHTQAAAVHISLSRFETASKFLEAAAQLDENVPITLVWLGFCRAREGRLAEAADLLKRALDKGLPTSLMYLPGVLVGLGRRSEALEAAETLEKIAASRYVSPMCRALAWAGLGARERCFDLLAQAVADRSPALTLSLLGPGYLAITPRFVQEWFATRRRQIGPAAFRFVGERRRSAHSEGPQ